MNCFLNHLTTMNRILFSLFIFLCFCNSILNAQQRYSGPSVNDCNSEQSSDQPSDFLYTCNGQKSTCQTFLIFRAQPPYDSIRAISNLMSSSPSELARINNVSIAASFPTNREVIVPVVCSCSGQYYQANSSYVIQSDETYYMIATTMYQGLSTCNSIIADNKFDALGLQNGMKLIIPLRCACPTSSQVEGGIRYLLSYLVYEDDDIFSLGKTFDASEKSILDANGLSELDPTIHPVTTILIPMQREPSSLQTKIRLPPPDSSPPPVLLREHKGSHKGLYVHIGISIAGGILLILILAFSISYYCRKKEMTSTAEYLEGNGKKKRGILPQDLLDGVADVNKFLKVFAFEELEAGTNNFSAECKIEGSVYRGIINEDVLAIKKMTRDVTKEVNILTKINHFNLIRLYGVSVAKENTYLVYEYMENGSLRDWLCFKNNAGVRSWNQRVQIALDVANGLHYLHNFTKPPYVHRYISSSNILLNGDLRAKISNFGFARMAEVGKDGKFELTADVAGTVGYIAPEYWESGLISPKLDVYAFGVVMLELLTGKNVVIECGEGKLLLSTLLISLGEGVKIEVELRDWVDPSFCDSFPYDLVVALAKLSLACLRRDPISRPCMDEVVSILSKIQLESLKWDCSFVKVV